MGSRKLTIIGGGGVRGPLFVEAAVRRAHTLGLSEIALVDIDTEKLRLIGPISRHLAADQAGLTLTTTIDARAALDGADFVVTTIRAGGEAGRVLDERIALSHGVLGQETTGPGGFGMALRSVPAILQYAELLAAVSPTAWLFNFTNPAGLVTQALRDAGHTRTVGICDGANLAQHAVAGHLGHPINALRPEVYGLNHLSWARAVRDTAGSDLLGPLLSDETFRANTLQRFFPLDLVELVGTWINEYLYYYYYAERAVEQISAERQTRGEEVVERNRALLARLDELDPERDPEEALRVYRAYEEGRRSTYMGYAEPDDGATGEGRPRPFGEGSEGYAGVALDLMEGLTGGGARYTAVNVPNEGAIAGLDDDDVVEVSCRVDADGVHPLPIGEIPAPQRALVQAVKSYERFTVDALRTRSRVDAVHALMAHPLVVSYSRATALADDYLAAHAEHVGAWA